MAVSFYVFHPYHFKNIQHSKRVHLRVLAVAQITALKMVLLRKCTGVDKNKSMVVNLMVCGALKVLVKVVLPPNLVTVSSFWSKLQ